MCPTMDDESILVVGVLESVDVSVEFAMAILIEVAQQLNCYAQIEGLETRPSIGSTLYLYEYEIGVSVVPR